MKIVVVIPARWASTRLPGKPLTDLLGTSMVMRVYNQVKKCKRVDQVIIATDHQDIVDHAMRFNAEVFMTSALHVSGTDRIAEVAQDIEADIIINVQGDEPLIHPEQIDGIIESMVQANSDISTQCISIDNSEVLFDYNVVKVVKDNQDRALYFSRQAIPAFRDLPYRQWLEKHNYWRHVGIYGFKKEVLLKLSKLAPTTLEQAESLEQLRWLQNGYVIDCFTTQYVSVGVDTEADVIKVEDLLLTNMFH